MEFCPRNTCGVYLFVIAVVVLQYCSLRCFAQLLAASSPFTRTRLTYLPDRGRHPTQWGAWSEWGPCSRTCGQGVTKRTRVCLVWTGHNFAQTYITLCSGGDVDYKLCTVTECPLGSLDYRHYQCDEAGRRLALNFDPAEAWYPAPRGDGRPCDLQCQSNTGWSQNMGTALDGTPCHGNNTHVCIQGVCKSVGCDGVIGSHAIRDVCGRCTQEGVNTTCFLVAGTYTRPYPDTSAEIVGYNFIVDVPKGSTHLYVKEKSSNLIALRDKTAGTFIINGQFTTSKNGVYTVAGTDFRYRRLPDGKETLESDGPLTRDAEILLVYKEINTGVYYHFWKPRRLSASDDPFVSVFIPKTPKPFPTRPPLTTTTTPTTTTTTTAVTTTTTTTTTPATTTRRTTGKWFYPTTTRRPFQTTPSLVDEAIWQLLMGEIESQNSLPQPLPSPTPPTTTTTTTEKPKPCEPCSKMKDAVFHFCDSDFVSHVLVNHKMYVAGETRYEVSIYRSYKKRMQLLDREFIWAPNLCNCPRLRVGRAYVIMGFMERHMDRELKLIVTPYAYVRRFSAKQHHRMLRLEKRVKC